MPDDGYRDTFKPKADDKGMPYLVVAVNELDGTTTDLHFVTQICLDMTNEPTLAADKGLSLVILGPSAGVPSEVEWSKYRGLTVIGDTHSFRSGVYESTPAALLKMKDQTQSHFVRNMINAFWKYVGHEPEQLEYQYPIMERKGFNKLHESKKDGRHYFELPETKVSAFQGAETFQKYAESKEYLYTTENSQKTTAERDKGGNPNNHDGEANVPNKEETEKPIKERSTPSRPHRGKP